MGRTINVDKNIYNALRAVRFTELQLFGTDKPTMLLHDEEDLFEYVDGKATEKVIGYKAKVLVAESGMESIIVKMENVKPVLTKEQIQERGGLVKVRFKNLTAKPYFSDREKEYKLSYRAEGLEVL